MFETDYRICKDNWCSEIKQLFEKVNKIDIYHNKHTRNIHEMQNSLHKIFTDKWLNHIQLNSKLRTYILFKNEYSTEEYVIFCSPRQDRSLLAQIRSGTLPLYVETGQFRDTKVENRTCLICNSKEIEDEYHFAAICKEYDIFRQSLHNKINEKSDIFRNLDNKEKFIFYNESRMEAIK